MMYVKVFGPCLAYIKWSARGKMSQLLVLVTLLQLTRLTLRFGNESEILAPNLVFGHKM